MGSSELWRGENAFQSIMMISAYPFMGLMFILPITYVLIALVIYLVVFNQLRVSILLKKRTEIEGITWLDSWTIRDLDYSEELLWGIENYTLLDYTIDDRIKQLDFYKKELEKIVEKIEEGVKATSKTDQNQPKTKELNEKEREVIETMQNIEPSANDFIELFERYSQIAKSKNKEDLKEWITEELKIKRIREKMRGAYVYLIKLKNGLSFDDREEHFFRHAVIITKFPWEAEFHFSKMPLDVDGYYVNARAARCALNIKDWVTDERPLVKIEWSEAYSLEKKSNEENIIMDKDKQLENKVLKSLVMNFENKAQRHNATIDRIQKQSDAYEELWEREVQRWDYAKDDWFNANANQFKVIEVNKKAAIFVLILLVILLAFVMSMFF